MIETNVSNNKSKDSKIVLATVGMLLLATIVIVALLRERIVNPYRNQVTIYGQGKVSSEPDQATVSLGVQVDKVPKAEDALSQLNEKVSKIIPALEALGIEKEDIKTENYSLGPQYDFKDGVQKVGGYSANQQLNIKVKDIKNNPDLVSQVIAEASKVGINQVLGINFEVSNLNDLKQQARIKAIEDAKNKAKETARAVGVKKLGKVVGWYENPAGSPGVPIYSADGRGGAEGLSSKAMPMPDVPSGTQEIVIEVGLNYEIN